MFLPDCIALPTNKYYLLPSITPQRWPNETICPEKFLETEKNMFFYVFYICSQAKRRKYRRDLKKGKLPGHSISGAFFQM